MREVMSGRDEVRGKKQSSATRSKDVISVYQNFIVVDT